KGAGVHLFVGHFDYLMTTVLVMAAPAMVLLLVVDLSFGLVNRYAPQLNVFALTLPIKAWISTAVILLLIGVYVEIVLKRLAASGALLSLRDRAFAGAGAARSSAPGVAHALGPVQHLGHRLEELLADVVVELDPLVQPARQGDVLHDRHARLLGGAADHLGLVAFALGDDHGQVGGAVLVLQCDCDVGRIRHDDTGSPDGAEHVLLRPLLVQLAAALIDVRVTLALLHLLLDVALAHAQLLQVGVLLVGRVECGDEEEHEHRPHDDADQT